jgi:tetratricopeptide (TPR) repeat protein
MKKYDMALNFFRALTEHVPMYPQGYGLTAATLMDLERYDEAIAYFKQALTTGDHPFAHSGLASCYMFKGDNAQSARHAERCLELDPANIEYIYGYGMYHHKFTGMDDPAFKALRDFEKKELKKSPPERQAQVHTVLYKAYNDMKMYDEAMEHAKQAGALRKEASHFTEEKSGRYFNNIHKFFTPEFFAQQKPSNNDSNVPVFILGMPRSGTTLLEQMLNAHPEVVGIGEDSHFGALLAEKSGLPHPQGVPYMYRRAPRENGLWSLDQMAQSHMAYLREKAPRANRIVDKGIAHFTWAGMLYLTFPRCHMIHLHRNPLDCCLSAFVRSFKDNAQPYTNDLHDLGVAYRRHMELMEHWKTVLPVPILDLRYEDIVEDPEGQTRRVLEFLALPWNENCLNFHENRKVVKTASVQQVRQPIYKSAMNNWKKYEKHLRPLVEGLGPYAPPESLYLLDK